MFTDFFIYIKTLHPVPNEVYYHTIYDEFHILLTIHSNKVISIIIIVSHVYIYLNHAQINILNKSVIIHRKKQFLITIRYLHIHYS